MTRGDAATSPPAGHARPAPRSRPRSVPAILALTALLSVTACGAAGPAADPVAQPGTSPTTADDTVDNGVSPMARNNVEKLPVATIRSTAERALAAAPSLHVTSRTGATTEDLTVRNGQGVVVQSHGDRRSTITELEQTLWIAADAAYWRAKGWSQAAAESLAAHTVRAPVTDETFATEAPHRRRAALERRIADLPALAVHGVTSHQGQPVIKMSDGGGTTLLLAATGTPFPLQLTTAEGDTAVTLTFDYADVAPLPTPSADVADLAAWR